MVRVGCWYITCCGRDSWTLLTFTNGISDAQLEIIKQNASGELGLDECSDENNTIFRNREFPVTEESITQVGYEVCDYKMSYIQC